MSKCIYESCKNRAYFNYEGNTKRQYCKLHRVNGMIYVPSYCKIDCAVKGCENYYPKYNYIGENYGIYCSRHKKENMIDVHRRKCLHPNCYIIPSYNYPDVKPPLYCKMHKLKDMVSLKANPCQVKGCKVLYSSFNYANQTPGLYCKMHKLQNMINIKLRKCQSEFCNNSGLIKQDGYCTFCFINLFPNRPTTYNYKTKEKTVVDFITSNFHEYTWIADKRIQDGCSLRRPDLFLDLGYQILLVEIDENQHKQYDCSCENKRLMEISKDLQHRSIVLIRFNPDGYYTKGIYTQSCWKLNSKGISIIPAEKNNEWLQRLNNLKDVIDYWVSFNETDKMIEIIHLYYDT